MTVYGREGLFVATKERYLDTVRIRMYAAMELFREDVIVATMEKAGIVIQEEEVDIPTLGRRNLGDVPPAAGGRLAAARPRLL